MKKVLMIATGGTIASLEDKDGLKPVLTSQDIIDYIPSIKKKIWIDTEQLFNLDSTNISKKHWLLIANRIKEKVAIRFNLFKTLSLISKYLGTFL